MNMKKRIEGAGQTSHLMTIGTYSDGRRGF
jgi:hypothetical protein